MISTRNIRFKYPGSAAEFSFPDIDCGRNQELLICGKSGTGKTTLLSLLGGLLKPTSGDILIGETTISQLSNAELDKFRGSSIGFVLQQHYFIEALSVEDNLLLSQRIAGKKTDRKTASQLLEELGLAHKTKVLPSRLSVGERQRLGIARAVINKPLLLLADEPTSSLDDENGEIVLNLLRKEVKHSEAALIMVSHDNRLKEVISNRIEL